MSESQVDPLSDSRADILANAKSRSVLELRDVNFAYLGGPPVLKSISATLSAGRLTAVLGPNAAGKSTLLKLMLGQLEPDSGSITIHGKPLTKISASERARQISYVPQRGTSGFAFTVKQIVAMGRYAHSVQSKWTGQALDQELTDRILDDLGLKALADRVFVELSGGQQQRVLLARAICQSYPTGQVMLLDEPATGLDLRHIHEAMHIMRERAESGLAVAVVLHDLSLASRYADDVWLMDEGEIVARGAWDEVMRCEILEPIYGVALRRIELTDGMSDGDKFGSELRPAFIVEPQQATLS